MNDNDEQPAPPVAESDYQCVGIDWPAGVASFRKKSKSVVAGVEEKRWTYFAHYRVAGMGYICCNGKRVADFSICTQFATALIDAHNASLGEPGEKEDLGGKEPSSALTHVRQIALELLIRWRRRSKQIAGTPLPISADYRDGLENAVNDCIADLEAILSSHSNAVLPHPVSESQKELLLDCRNQISALQSFIMSGERLTDKDRAEITVLLERIDKAATQERNSESPVGSTATVVSDEEIAIARNAAEDWFSERGRSMYALQKIILTAIRKAKSLSEPKEQRG